MNESMEEVDAKQQAFDDLAVTNDVTDSDDVDGDDVTDWSLSSAEEEDVQVPISRPAPNLPRLNMDLLKSDFRNLKYEAVAPLNYANQTPPDAISPEPQPPAPKNQLSGQGGSFKSRTSSSRRSSSLIERTLNRLGIQPNKQAEFISEFRLYLVFLVVFTVATLGRTTQGVPYGWSHYLHNRFAPDGNRFQDDGTLLPAFKSVLTVDLLWRYLQTTFVNALHPIHTQYRDLGPIGGSTILGAINLHQERVEAINCPDDDVDCVPRQIVPLRPSTDPFGPGNVFQYKPDTDSDLNQWFWSPHAHIGAEFTELLKPTPDGVRSRLAQLRNQSWIDIGTVGVYIDFALYNPQIKMLCAVSLRFQTPPYGGVQAHSYFRVVDIRRYSSTGKIIVTCFEFLVVVLAFVHGYLTVRKWISSGSMGVLRDTWLLLDVLNLTGIAIIVGYRIVFAVVVPQLVQRTGTDPYTDWQSYAYTAQQLRALKAVLALFTWIKMLKYVMLVSPQLQSLEQIFLWSRPRVYAFAFIFALVVLGFGQAFFMAFHVEIDGFRSFSHSLVTLIGAMLHGYDITEIRTQNWLLGPMLYVVFVVIASLILLHMFLAIMQAAYHNVRGDIERDQRSHHVSDVIKATMQEVRRCSVHTITTPSLRTSMKHGSKPGSSPATPSNHVGAERRAPSASDEDEVTLPGQIAKSMTDSTSATT